MAYERYGGGRKHCCSGVMLRRVWSSSAVPISSSKQLEVLGAAEWEAEGAQLPVKKNHSDLPICIFIFPWIFDARLHYGFP